MRILFWILFLCSFGAMAQKNTIKQDENTQKLVGNIIRIQNNNNLKATDFSYSFYEKAIVSAHPDSISASIDTVFKNKKKNEIWN